MSSLSADVLALRPAAPEARYGSVSNSRLHARVSPSPSASLACSRSAAFCGEKPLPCSNASSSSLERRAAPRHSQRTARRGPGRTEAVLKSVQELLGGAAGGENGSAGGQGPPLDCVVVGGGISGLCAALALETDHADTAPRVVVTEARERVGGNITTVEGENGYLWEEGPNSFQPNDAMLKCAVSAPCLSLVPLKRERTFQRRLSCSVHAFDFPSWYEQARPGAS